MTKGPRLLGEKVYCQCGGNCGLWWVRTQHQRCRKFHVACPVIVERRRLQENARQRNYDRENRKYTGRGSHRPKATDLRESIKWCKACGGMAHRRPPEGCPKCKEPAGEDTPLNQREILRSNGGWM